MAINTLDSKTPLPLTATESANIWDMLIQRGYIDSTGLLTPAFITLDDTEKIIDVDDEWIPIKKSIHTILHCARILTKLPRPILITKEDGTMDMQRWLFPYEEDRVKWFNIDVMKTLYPDLFSSRLQRKGQTGREFFIQSIFEEARHYAQRGFSREEFTGFNKQTADEAMQAFWQAIKRLDFMPELVTEIESSSDDWLVRFETLFTSNYAFHLWFKKAYPDGTIGTSREITDAYGNINHEVSKDFWFAVRDLMHQFRYKFPSWEWDSLHLLSEEKLTRMSKSWMGILMKRVMFEQVFHQHCPHHPDFRVDSPRHGSYVKGVNQKILIKQDLAKLPVDANMLWDDLLQSEYLVLTGKSDDEATIIDVDHSFERLSQNRYTDIGFREALWIIFNEAPYDIRYINTSHITYHRTKWQRALSFISVFLKGSVLGKNDVTSSAQDILRLISALQPNDYTHGNTIPHDIEDAPNFVRHANQEMM